MSNERFEVAFSGQLSEGANLQNVKARVGKMFNADAAKLDQLFSGQRIVIKKNVDHDTAQKYRTALRSAGAECEITATSAAPTTAAKPASAPAAPTAAASSAPPPAAAAPPQTAPLGVTADQIGDLDATLAPVGSELQSEIRVVPEPQYDLSAFDLAPVGSTLGEKKKDPPPPPPDTSGLTLVD